MRRARCHGHAGIGGASYQYDGAERLITTALPNGVVLVNAYDSANRLTSLRHKNRDSSLLAQYLYQLNGVGNRVAVTETVRAGRGADDRGLRRAERAAGAGSRNGTATASASQDWQTQTAQAGYEGTGYRRALPDIGARYEETETASSPSLSWPIYNQTADTYSVWVQGMAPDAGGDSVHVGLDEETPSTAAHLTGFTDEWSWSKVTMVGGNATVDRTTTGEHTLEAYMREDGLRLDRMLLITDTNYIPSGHGPAESPLQTITITIPGGLDATSITYSYNALYRLTGAQYTDSIAASLAYVYDSVGNMTAFTETVEAHTTSVRRTFDGANRLESAIVRVLSKDGRSTVRPEIRHVAVPVAAVRNSPIDAIIASVTSRGRLGDNCHEEDHMLVENIERIVSTEIVVPATVAEVWEAWTTRDGARSFFAPDCHIELRPRGPYEIYFDPDAQPGKRGGDGMLLLACQPQRMLSFTWNAPLSFPAVRPHMTHVTVRLHEQGDGQTRVSLVHDGWGEGREWDEAFDYFSQAWHAVVLPRLKYRFVHGPVDWNERPSVEALAEMRTGLY